MADDCSVVLKRECTESIDVMIARPIKGSVRITQQGAGVKTGFLVVAGDTGGENAKISCENMGSGTAVATVTTEYSGTPYKVTTIRYME